jgi:hypothetical protein
VAAAVAEAGTGGRGGATTGNQAPDFLVIGHVVQDLLDGEWRAGGAVTYAGLLARNLGLRTAVLTACGDDFPIEDVFSGVEVQRLASRATSQIRNVYAPEGRTQWVPRRAEPIASDGGGMPPGWRESSIVLLGPVAGELDAGAIDLFPRSVVGVGVQGWLRKIGPDAHVTPVPSKSLPDELLTKSNAVFVSVEDLPATEVQATVKGWARRSAIVALTRGDGGADVSYKGEWRHIDAFPAVAVDPTGAGDVFAASFLAALSESGDPWEAARFAAAAAACVVEGEGPAGVPNRAQVEERLRLHPEILAQAR